MGFEFKELSTDQNSVKLQKNLHNKIVFFSIVLTLFLLVSGFIGFYIQQTQLNQLNEKFNVFKEFYIEKNELKKEISKFFDSNVTTNFRPTHFVDSKLRFKRDYEEYNTSNQDISRVTPSMQISKEVR